MFNCGCITVQDHMCAQPGAAYTQPAAYAQSDTQGAAPNTVSTLWLEYGIKIRVGIHHDNETQINRNTSQNHHYFTK